MMCFVGIGIIILVPLLITRIKTIYLSFISNVIFCIPERNKYRFWMSALCKIAVLRSFEVNICRWFLYSLRLTSLSQLGLEVKSQLALSFMLKLVLHGK